MRDYRHPVSIVTKSTLALRDLDLLAEIARVTEVIVFFTVTTVDAGIWRAVEPGTPPPAKRLEVMQRLREAGVPAGVFMAPVMPGITDSQESINAVARAAKEHGAVSFGASPLRLAPLVKEHYFGFIRDKYPQLLGKYKRSYFGPNAPQDYVRALDQRVDRAMNESGFKRNSMSYKEGDRYAPAAHPVPPPTHVQQLLLLP
jgi:DNA repair photolyase